MNDNNVDVYVIGWICSTVAIVTIAALTTFTRVSNTEQYIKNGYVQQQNVGCYGKIWVKK